MKHTFRVLAALVLISLASCVKPDQEVIDTIRTNPPSIILEATKAVDEPETRAVKQSWYEGDRIYICFDGDKSRTASFVRNGTGWKTEFVNAPEGKLTGTVNGLFASMIDADETGLGKIEGDILYTDTGSYVCDTEKNTINVTLNLDHHPVTQVSIQGADKAWVLNGDGFAYVQDLWASFSAEGGFDKAVSSSTVKADAAHGIRDCSTYVDGAGEQDAIYFFIAGEDESGKTSFELCDQSLNVRYTRTYARDLEPGKAVLLQGPLSTSEGNLWSKTCPSLDFYIYDEDEDRLIGPAPETMTIKIDGWVTLVPYDTATGKALGVSNTPFGDTYDNVVDCDNSKISLSDGLSHNCLDISARTVGSTTVSARYEDDILGTLTKTFSISTKGISSISANRQLDYKKDSELDISFRCSADWSIDVADNAFFTVTPLSGSAGKATVHLVATSENTDFTKTLSSSFTIKSDGITRKVTITQKQAPVPGTADGDVVTFAEHTVGNGIPIVIMGDGFMASEIASSKYYQSMMRAYEYFFNIEPYASMKGLFDVKAVTVVSNSKTFDGSSTRLKVKFGTGTHVEGDDNICRTYGYKAFSITRTNDATIIVVVNIDKYAGTAYLSRTGLPGDIPTGPAIAYVPMSTETSASRSMEALVHHEAGGHAFGKLADEYFTTGQTISSTDLNKLLDWQKYAYYRNVDTHDDITQTYWAKFAADARFAKESIGMYRGGYYNEYGVYRPNDQSVMRGNAGNYNAPSREMIYKRAMRIAYGSSWSYDYETFVAFDKIHTKSASYRMSPLALDDEEFVPLGEPVLIIAD